MEDPAIICSSPELEFHVDFYEPRFALDDSSAGFERAHRQTDRLSAGDITLLHLGESGTGTELLARTVREKSFRRDGPFVAVNGAAIP